MKITSHIIVITRNYDRIGSDLHIIELESYVCQIIKGYGCERDKEYIEQNAGNLNAVILYFRTGVQSDSE